MASTPDPRPTWHWTPRAHPILVVEDEEHVRRLLVETLEAEGHPVIAASNGAIALELAVRHRPALIILDLPMPVLDGRALPTAYRSSPPPHARIAICTAHPHPIEQARA